MFHVTFSNKKRFNTYYEVLTVALKLKKTQCKWRKHPQQFDKIFKEKKMKDKSRNIFTSFDSTYETKSGTNTEKKQPNTDNVWLCFLYLLCCVCCHVGEYVFFCVFFSRTALRATVIFASNEWFNCLLLSWRCTKHINGWLDTVYFSLYGPITMVTLGNPSRSFDVLYSQSQKVSFWLSDRVFFVLFVFLHKIPLIHQTTVSAINQTWIISL